MPASVRFVRAFRGSWRPLSRCYDRGSLRLTRCLVVIIEQQGSKALAHVPLTQDSMQRKTCARTRSAKRWPIWAHMQVDGLQAPNSRFHDRQALMMFSWSQGLGSHVVQST